MRNDFSKEALLEFLNYLGNKGLMNSATVAARKAAVSTFLSILSDDESQDLRTVDLDDISLRFSHLKGDEFKPDSLKVYKSRVSSALNDLTRYRANPLSFRPNLVPRIPSLSKTGTKEATPKILAATGEKDEGSEVVFPVPIRPNVVVRITGMPSDLTKKEASKIANVVFALATDSEPNV